MKVILAYIVARSVWEFYNSDWMSRPWNADDIHFLQEPPGDIDGQPVVSVNRPYLAVQWRENQTLMDDTSTEVGKVHRYPRVLSLGLMLIEIGTGKRASDLFPDYQKNVNSAWLSAKEFLVEPSPWEDFDYRSYWDAVRSCVNNQFFLRANPAVGSDMLADVEGRRQMIFDDVVTPLEDLLSGTGWVHDIWTVGPMKTSSTCSVSAFVASLAKRGDSQGNGAGQTAQRAIGTARRGHGQPGASFENLSISTPATQLRPRDRLGFEIAIICALPAEADAVISLFDVHWDKPDRTYGKAARDLNAYTTGRIGQHNVVVVHMPSMGKVSAANVAQGLRSSFENIQLALVVGICGGVPYRQRNKQEIFLGDVVISRSLIQYDFGRQYPGAFEAKDSLQGGSGKPSAEIRSILAKPETSHHRHELEITTAQFVRDSQLILRRSVYPGAQKDKLFESTSLHRHHTDGACHTCLSEGAPRICVHALESSCEELGCEASGVLRRVRLKNGAVPPGQLGLQSGYCPSIHIGNMGSGDTVMKSGTHRDEVARKYDIIGFEMEGAGIWDFFPSMVIKAVCDYADSHKNKEWQSYAAVTAAAATKAFLQEWRPEGAS
jgi:nucleoside phosphorylase